MIPKEFKNTYQLQQELNQLLEQEEIAILKTESPDLANQLEVNINLMEVYESQPDQQYKKQISKSFNKEYEEQNNATEYFLGCSFTIYSDTYESRLKAFKSDYKDAKEHNFIYDELETLTHFDLPSYIDKKLVKSINYSLESAKDFLINKLEHLGFKVTFSKNDNGLETLIMKTEHKDLSIQKMDNSNLKWEGDKTHLVELGMALIASNSINVGKGINKLSESEFYGLLANFFNIEKLYHEKYKRDIRNRVKDDTVFIPLLDEALKKDIQNWLK
ncbi:RteC domain-containing protein [Psychroserpens sp.]